MTVLFSLKLLKMHGSLRKCTNVQSHLFKKLTRLFDIKRSFECQELLIVKFKT